MAATLEITCPNCRKEFKVPVEFAGKLIRCKGCQTAFEVPGPKGAAPARPAAAKPATAARPAAAKPAAPATAKPADPSAPIPFKDEEPPKRPAIDDDEDEGGRANPYGVQADDLDIPRCPFCAKELDPPDTKICLNCGYDLLARKRHESRKVYELTTQDYIMHWLPAFACILVVIVLVTISVICGLNMRDWLTGSFLDSEEKNEITGKTKFYVGPLCFNIWIWVISAWLSFKAGKFAYYRLVVNWRPEEQVKKS